MSNTTLPDDAPSRRKTVRDVLIFQIKLWLEGFKDILLMPLSLGAALLDLVVRKKKGRGALYSVMKLGDRFERWVDLYASLDKRENEKAEIRSRSLDTLLNEAADGVEEKATDGRSGTASAGRSDES